MNLVRFAEVIRVIETDPKSWDQSGWHCETAHCLGGHAQILAGKPPVDGKTMENAIEWLDLTELEASYLFSPDRTLEDFNHVLELATACTVVARRL